MSTFESFVITGGYHPDQSISVKATPPPDYVGGAKKDYVGARRVVNGTDRAAMIGGYAKAFEAALKEAGYSTNAIPPAPAGPVPAPEPVQKPEAAPAPVVGKGDGVAGALLGFVILVLLVAAAIVLGIGG